METICDNDNKKADYQKSIDKIRFQTIKSINSKMNWNSLMTSKEDFDSDLSKINELTDINFSDELITLLNDGIKVWIECLLRYTEHWPIVYIPYIVKVSGCLFFRVV